MPREIICSFPGLPVQASACKRPGRTSYKMPLTSFRRRDRSQPYSPHLSWRSYAFTTMHRVDPPLDEKSRKAHFPLPRPSGGAYPFRNICKGVKREVNGELLTLICSYHSVIDHCWVGWWVTQKKSIEKGQAYMLYEMISDFIYAMPCIVFVCVSFSFFTSAPWALLRFIEERDPLRVKSKGRR